MASMEITEAQKIEHIKINNFYCESHNALLSRIQCGANRSRAMRLDKSNKLAMTSKDVACLSCKIGKKIQPKLDKSKKPLNRICQTYQMFPDLCVNLERNGVFKEDLTLNPRISKGIFRNKVFCCNKCALILGNIRKRGHAKHNGILYRWKDRKINEVA